jgi:hypothetical protein
MALSGPPKMSNLSQQSAAKRTLIRSLTAIAPPRHRTTRRAQREFVAVPDAPRAVTGGIHRGA